MMLLRDIDIAWAAGFLEGEGCFQIKPQITASQVQKEPVEKLVYIFGGSITQYGPYGSSKQTKAYWLWRISGARCTDVAKQIFDYMSPRRQQQITAMLDAWKKSPGATYNRNVDRNKCPSGHEKWAHHKKTGWRYCMECNRTKKRILRSESRRLKDWPESQSEP